MTESLESAVRGFESCPEPALWHITADNTIFIVAAFNLQAIGSDLLSERKTRYLTWGLRIGKL